MSTPKAEIICNIAVKRAMNGYNWHQTLTEEERRIVEKIVDDEIVRNNNITFPEDKCDIKPISKEDLTVIVRQYVAPAWCSVDQLVDALYNALPNVE